MTPEPIVRKYKVADPYMIEYAKSLRGSFIIDQAIFEGEDSNYANPFEDDWETAITTAESHPTDEQRDDQLTQLTADVLTEMANCRDVYQGAKRYILKAFPNDVTKQNEFGLDDYDAVGRKQPLMIPFMQRLHATSVKYAAQLADPAVNFSAARIAEIGTRATALDTANKAQEDFMRIMPGFTKERIDAMNAVWDYCADVAEVGKRLFKNDYAKYQQYLLPPSDEPATTLVLSGIVTQMGSPVPGGGPGQPIVGALTQLIPQGLQSQTDSNGKFGYGSAAAGPGMLRVTHPLFMEQNIPVNIDPENPQVINVQMMPMGPMPPMP